MSGISQGYIGHFSVLSRIYWAYTKYVFEISQTFLSHRLTKGRYQDNGATLGDSIRKKLKVKWSLGHKAVILSLYKLSIKSKKSKTSFKKVVQFGMLF